MDGLLSAYKGFCFFLKIFGYYLIFKAIISFDWSHFFTSVKLTDIIAYIFALCVIYQWFFLIGKFFFKENSIIKELEDYKEKYLEIKKLCNTTQSFLGVLLDLEIEPEYKSEILLYKDIIQDRLFDIELPENN